MYVAFNFESVYISIFDICVKTLNLSQTNLDLGSFYFEFHKKSDIEQMLLFKCLGFHFNLVSIFRFIANYPKS